MRNDLFGLMAAALAAGAVNTLRRSSPHPDHNPDPTEHDRQRVARAEAKRARRAAKRLVERNAHDT